MNVPVKYKRPKYTRNKSISHEQLTKRLTITLAAIFFLLFAGIIGFSFFSPQIGSLFGFISVNRNDTGPTAKVSLTAPSFLELPEFTNSKLLTFEGFATPKTIIKLYINGPEVAEATSGDDGLFRFENVELNNGRNTLFTKAIGSDGQESEKSVTKIVVYDDKAPDIEVTSPREGETVKNLNNRINIIGKISEKAAIRINDKFVVQKPDFSFDFLLGVEKGTVKIKVEATDEAGNKKTEEFTVNYVKEAA